MLALIPAGHSKQVWLGLNYNPLSQLGAFLEIQHPASVVFLWIGHSHWVIQPPICLRNRNYTIGCQVTGPVVVSPVEWRPCCVIVVIERMLVVIHF